MSSHNDEIPDSVKSALMRQRVSQFLDDPAAVAEMSPGEIALAIRLGFKDARAFLEKDSGTSN